MLPQINKVFYLKANYLKTTILHCGIKDLNFFPGGGLRLFVHVEKSVAFLRLVKYYSNN